MFDQSKFSHITSFDLGIKATNTKFETGIKILFEQHHKLTSTKSFLQLFTYNNPL